MNRLLPKCRKLALYALPLLVLAAGSAHAVGLVGLTSANEIAQLDTNNLAASTRVAITGLAQGDRFVGIDLRPADNKIYGVTLSNQIYTVDELTGATTFVAALSQNVVMASRGYGIDFNPNADFAGASSLRFVSTAGDNFAINPTTGLVGNTGSNIGAGYSGVGYTNSSVFPGSQPSTELYYLNSLTSTLDFAPGSFNSPTITQRGPLGVDALRANGFEVLPDGSAFAALNVDAGTSLVTGIYGIDLATGAATLIGNYNGTLSGLTVSAVPEASTYAMMLLGMGAIGFSLRRRRQG